MFVFSSPQVCSCLYSIEFIYTLLVPYKSIDSGSVHQRPLNHPIDVIVTNDVRWAHDEIYSLVGRLFKSVPRSIVYTDTPLSDSEFSSASYATVNFCVICVLSLLFSSFSSYFPRARAEAQSRRATREWFSAARSTACTAARSCCCRARRRSAPHASVWATRATRCIPRSCSANSSSRSTCAPNACATSSRTSRRSSSSTSSRLTTLTGPPLRCEISVNSHCTLFG